MSKITDAARRKARKGLRNLKRFGRREFSCACGCGKQWRDYRLMNAHFLAKNGGYWAGRAGKAMGRQMGKGQDTVRKLARGGREAFGHVNRKGNTTAKARSRPAFEGDRAHLKMRDLRDRHRHGRDHDRADNLDNKATRTRKPGRQIAHAHRAARLRNRWPERARTRTP